MFDDLIPKQPATPAPSGGLSFDDLIPASAKAELAKGLREGRNNDQEIYRTAAFRTNQGVRPANATDAAISGATAGFADEISAGARAPIDMLTRGESYNEAYQHNLAAELDRMAQYRNANPVTATAAEVAGGLAVPTGRAGAIKTGIVTGGLFGAGNSEGDLAQRVSDGAVGGAMGGTLGGVLSGAVKAFGGKAPSAAPTINELKAAAAKGYNSEAVKGLEVAPRAISDAAIGIRAKLDDAGFSDVIATKAHGILKRLEFAPEGSVVTGRNLHSIQKTLGKAAGSADPQERAAASMALGELNKYLETVPAAHVLKGSADDFARTIREANANYAAAMQSGKIDQKIVQAEIRAGAANSGMNVGNTVRQRMADVAINPSMQRGLGADEVGMARRISEGSRLENAVRTAGNMAGGGGGIASLASGGLASFAVGDLSGFALPAVGMALRGMGNRMTLAQAEKLSTAIRNRAPLASASQKFEERVAQFHAARNAKTASAAALAARNLATNLKGAGFNISASDLMRALQSPVAGRAGEDQPEIPRPPGQ